VKSRSEEPPVQKRAKIGGGGVDGWEHEDGGEMRIEKATALPQRAQRATEDAEETKKRMGEEPI